MDAVQKVDAAFSDSSTNVYEVHKLLESMAQANQAQSSAIIEISATVGAMDKATQQNAAMVEQTSAAARTMTVKVASLADQAALFKTGASARSRASSVASVEPTAAPWLDRRPASV